MIKTKIKDMFKKTNIFIEFILSILLSVNILNVLYNYIIIKKLNSKLSKIKKG